MIRTPRLAARRIRQSLRFANGLQVLWQIATGPTRWGTEELVFELRSGETVRCPNVAGARVPVYELFIEDAYRLAELTEGLRDDFVALDIGGQIGCFSTALARHAPKATIHTFEASPTTADWLRRNIAGNDLGERVFPRHLAVTEHVGIMEFADNGSGSGLNGVTAPAGSTTVVEVPCTTFGAAVAQAGGRVDLVKIDTEGAEYDIVLSSDPASWASVQRVVIEYHPVPGRSWAELARFFAAVGLVVTRIEAADEGLGTAWLRR
ncbi:FkbM family methyltransferase [Nocardioides sp. NPDC057772]|uniref:FkbM family methyltransferase n=1 Tax=Nocardioides sp. NPDC057772 TaxID=3346245 RepID=UPI0036700C8D